MLTELNGLSTNGRCDRLGCMSALIPRKELLSGFYCNRLRMWVGVWKRVFEHNRQMVRTQSSGHLNCINAAMLFTASRHWVDYIDDLRTQLETLASDPWATPNEEQADVKRRKPKLAAPRLVKLSISTTRSNSRIVRGYKQFGESYPLQWTL